MVKVGVIGLGMMGSTHLDVYSKNPNAQVVAISDLNPDLLAGKAKAQGNIEGQAKGGFDFASVRKYPEGKLLIADPDIDLVDVCLPTPLHMEFGLLVLKAGKHLMIEKPLARTYKDAAKLAAAAQNAKGKAMCAMCMRFWPGWTWVKQMLDTQTYGKCLSAQFKRASAMPRTGFYPDGKASGGAVLDMHIHDSDFVQFCFGLPAAVSSFGQTKCTGEIDFVISHYHYEHGPLVSAEVNWFAEPVPFNMLYTICFERATAIFDLSKPQPLMLYEIGQQPRAIELEPAMGYQKEIEYFLDCIVNNRHPEVVTLPEAANSVKLVEAEVKSALAGGKRTPVKI